MKKLLVYLSLTFYVGSLFSQTPVADNGRLKVIGHKLCNEKGKPIQLKGMCLFALMHEPECVTFDGFKTLTDKWKVDVIRAPIYVNNFTSQLNYTQSPNWNNMMIDSMVIWAEKLGVYLILDWHNDAPYGNPTDSMFKGADAFFDLMSSKYASKKHIMYELFNEPYTKDKTPKVTWDSIVKYSNRVMPKIRKNDTNAIILVGCPDWDQKLASVDTSMLNDNKNVMFTFHFYAASHKSLYTSFMMEIHRIPVFVSEWGTCASDGNGSVDTYTSNLFLNAFKQDISSDKDTVMLSWCNFSYGDKAETASSLKPGSCRSLLWDNTTADGNFVKYWLINNTAPPLPVVPPIYTKLYEKDSLFSIYPNPATNSITIATILDTKISVSVKNMLGIDVIDSVIFEKNATINIEALPLGIYYVVFTNEGKQASLLFSKIK